MRLLDRRLAALEAERQRQRQRQRQRRDAQRRSDQENDGSGLPPHLRALLDDDHQGDGEIGLRTATAT